MPTPLSFPVEAARFPGHFLHEYLRHTYERGQLGALHRDVDAVLEVGRVNLREVLRRLVVAKARREVVRPRVQSEEGHFEAKHIL